MNDSSTYTKRASKDFTNLFQKKKSLPISIITNPNQGQFLFRNNLSNIVTSYKDISEKIQNNEKQKVIPQSKNTTNFRIFNNFLSVNTKNSHLSNQSSVSKNTSNIISQRILPAKNISTTSFSKGFLINALNANKQKASNTNRNYLQVKTENSLISLAKNKHSKDKESKRTKNNKSRELIKKNFMRQKSIGVLPSSEKILKMEYGYTSNEAQNNTTINNNHYSTKHSKVVFSNADEHLYKNKFIKKKISMIKYNLKNFIQNAKHTNKLIKEKKLTLTTKGNYNCTKNNNINNTHRKKRGLSHDLELKVIRTKSTNSQYNFQIRETLPKNNRTISINQISIHSLQSTLIDMIKEKNTKPTAQGRIPHQPIQVHVQPLMSNSILNTSHKPKNGSNEVLTPDVDNNDYETDRDNCYHKDDKYNMFDYLSMTNTNEEEEDKFDNLNSIVRAIDFKSVLLKEESLFNSKSEAYKKYEQKFNNCFDLSCNKTKCSERKKMNISISTQDNSYKKHLSPNH